MSDPAGYEAFLERAEVFPYEESPQSLDSPHDPPESGVVVWKVRQYTSGDPTPKLVGKPHPSAESARQWVLSWFPNDRVFTLTETPPEYVV